MLPFRSVLVVGLVAHVAIPIAAHHLRAGCVRCLVGGDFRRRLLRAPRRAGEALGLLGGAEQRLRLVDAFLLLGLGIGVGDDAGTGLHVHLAVLDERRAQNDAA